MGTTHYVYLATNEPVLGFYFGIGSNANAEAVTLDWEYCSTAEPTAIAFTDVAGDSDGTDSIGATLAVDGAYTFTLPAIKRSSMNPYGTAYWYRFKPSAALSATVDINEIIPIYQNTNYGYMEAGEAVQMGINRATTSGFAIISPSGTPTLDISWLQY
jgi:hypothetical protein